MEHTGKHKNDKMAKREREKENKKNIKTSIKNSQKQLKQSYVMHKKDNNNNNNNMLQHVVYSCSSSTAPPCFQRKHFSFLALPLTISSEIL